MTCHYVDAPYERLFIPFFFNYILFTRFAYKTRVLVRVLIENRRRFFVAKQLVIALAIIRGICTYIEKAAGNFRRSLPRCNDIPMVEEF